MSEPLPVRYSYLKLMARSPAHARFAMDQAIAGADDWDDSPARFMGRLAHTVALGRGQELAVFPGPVRRGKEWEKFAEANASKMIVKQAELETAQAMAKSLLCHEEARQYVQGGEYVEHTFQALMGGRLIRFTPDTFEPGAFLFDLKTTTDASPERFPWQALKLGYHGQLAFYLDGVELLGIQPPETVAIAAIESKPPYAVCLYTLTPAAIDFGRRLYRKWFEDFLNCERSGSWPCYGPGVLDAPADTYDLEGFTELDEKEEQIA